MNYKSVIRKNWRSVIYLAIFFMLALILQDVVKEAIVFDYNVDAFDQELTNRLRQEVFNRVDSKSKAIESSIKLVNEEIEEHILDDLDPLLFAIDAQNSNNELETVEYKQSILLETVKLYDLTNTLHCFYVLDAAGVELYSCESQDFTNLDRYNDQDYFNRYYMKEIVDNTNLDGSAKTEFFIEQDTEIYKHLSYTYLDDETNYIVGVHIVYENYNELSKDALISSFNNSSSNSKNELVIIDGDSTILQESVKQLVGLKLVDITSNERYLALKQIYDYGINTDAGYLEYIAVVDSEEVEKIAYVKYIEEWDIIIAASSDSGTYDHLINDFKVDNYNYTILIKVPIYIIMLLLGYIIYRLIKSNVELSLSLVDEEEHLYKRFANITTDSIVITDESGLIQFINEYGKNSLFSRIDDVREYNLNNLLVEEDGYYTIFSEKQTYHVKYNVEKIMYNSENCDLYIIKDLTDKIVTEKALKAMTVEDELTKLGNRRLLVNDFQTKVIPYIKEGNNSQLVMVDLDNFKKANDKYGHQFGDQVLVEIANIFTNNFSDLCNIYRLGGDEFAVLTKGQTKKELLLELEEINQIIMNYDFGKEVDLSFCAGIVEIQVTDVKRRLSDYYELADEKLYQAKEEGKGTIIY